MDIFDGHVHTHYCPHGTNAEISAYIERAPQLGYSQISFTEHAPLPETFSDPAPTRDSSMAIDEFRSYIEELKDYQRAYAGRIAIKIGLEIDYIEGHEEETKQLLSELGPNLADSILSVHFLRLKDEWFCLDYSEKEFERIIERFGTTEAVYDAYYKTLEKAILSDLGPYKPKRLGHLSLVSKFQKKYPSSYDSTRQMLSLLPLIKQKGYQLDVNTAGLFKPLCKEIYPPETILHTAANMGIPLVYGSDSHHPSDLGRGLDALDPAILEHLIKP